jgi:hypothetical protein
MADERSPCGLIDKLRAASCGLRAHSGALRGKRCAERAMAGGALQIVPLPAASRAAVPIAHTLLVRYIE